MADRMQALTAVAHELFSTVMEEPNDYGNA